MRAFVAIMLLAGGPFWEVKPPGDWTDDELAAMFQSSPWVKTLENPAKAKGASPTPAYLATARPMREAEQEQRRRLRQRTPTEEPQDTDYEDFLSENEGQYIVLAVLQPNPAAPADAKETTRMEEESVLRVGRKTYKTAGHFPPDASDPYLRLVFPRAIERDTKSLVFDLYLPATPFPYRQVEFWLKDLSYKGKPEM
jgi:hypothetical protein